MRVDLIVEEHRYRIFYEGLLRAPEELLDRKSVV